MLNKKNYFLFVVLITSLLASNYLYSQSNTKNKVNLQNKYNTILKDIKGIEGLIEKTESKKKHSLNQLNSLSAKIDSRKTLIENINDQIIILDEGIIEKKGQLNSLNEDIKRLKDDYSKMVYYSYKNLNTTSTISFLLSAETFNQALRRFNYLKSYAKFRKIQAEQLKETIGSIELKVEKLEYEKELKKQLLNEEEHQKKVLVTEKLQKNNLVSKLKNDSKSLKKQITHKNKSALALNNQIQKIIQKEILAAERKTKKYKESNSKESVAFVKKEIKLSKDFVKNKGKLPWPVKKGHIVEHFGKHPHPTLENVIISNNGVEIRTDKAQYATSIFDGVVVNSFYLPTTQNSIIVKHGEYFTVYSNLKTVIVNLGDQVKTGQKLGIAYTSEENITKIHLEVWKSTTKLNPEYWIKRASYKITLNK